MAERQATRLTVQLASGGSVTVELAADPLQLSPRDRTVVFSVADAMNEYRKRHEPLAETAPEPGEAMPGLLTEAQRRG